MAKWRFRFAKMLSDIQDRRLLEIYQMTSEPYVLVGGIIMPWRFIVALFVLFYYARWPLWQSNDITS